LKTSRRNEAFIHPIQQRLVEFRRNGQRAQLREDSLARLIGCGAHTRHNQIFHLTRLDRAETKRKGAFSIAEAEVKGSQLGLQVTACLLADQIALFRSESHARQPPFAM
jgi:hypothetical protein